VIAVYIVLGVLYESTIHPITILSTLPSAGIGALIALMITGNDLSLMAVIAIILLIGIVKKERDHHDRFRARRGADARATAPASDLRCLAQTLPPDHDDDDGGTSRLRSARAWHWPRIGAARRPENSRRERRSRPQQGKNWVLRARGFELNWIAYKRRVSADYSDAA